MFSQRPFKIYLFVHSLVFVPGGSYDFKFRWFIKNLIYNNNHIKIKRNFIVIVIQQPT